MSTEEKTNVEPVTTEAPKENKGGSKNEKKFRKAMIKQGLKVVEGVTRVTIKTNKNYVLYIDEPEVMKSENGYMVFGQAKFQDFEGNLANKQAEKFKEGKKAEEEVKVIKEESEDENEEDAGDLNQDDIENLMNYNNVSRNKAIRLLKKTNGDLVEAINMLDQA